MIHEYNERSDYIELLDQKDSTFNLTIDIIEKMKKDVIKEAIAEGISFLASKQEKDGSFLGYSSPSQDDFKNARAYHSVFPSTLTLSCLNTLEETEHTKNIKEKLATFLRGQKSKHWTFNYWVRGSEESKTLPYPDDLDDTSCALSSLCGYKPNMIGGFALAKIVTVLTALEEKEGGPYKTWLVQPDAEEVWKDVDLAVNANIGYFLSLQEVDLPEIVKLMESAIEDKKYTSPYYPSEYSIIYFISRWYRGEKRGDIIEYLLSNKDLHKDLNKNGHKDSNKNAPHFWGNPLNTALAVTSLLNLGCRTGDLEKHILYILEHQEEGVWQPQAFCIDPTVEKRKHYAGSSALTTAFCVEALSSYLSSKSEEIDDSASADQSRIVFTDVMRETTGSEEFKDEDEENMYNEVVTKVRQRFELLGSELRNELKEEANNYLDTFLKGKKSKEVLLLPYYFRASLCDESAKNVSDECIVSLGSASLYGWIAYTIYDDFLDNEGDTKLLSVAHVSLRELTSIFNEVLPKETGFRNFSRMILDTVDYANAWEIKHTRVLNLKEGIVGKVPEYNEFSQLADKSIGHALAPISVLFSLGYTESSPEVKNLMKFFRYYIIARQLDDDAHDWEDDFKAGYINAVGALILKEVHIKSWLSSGRDRVDLETLQQVFWHNVAPEVCENILRYSKRAKEALTRISILADVSLLEAVLISTEHSAESALEEREETVAFLDTYEQQ